MALREPKGAMNRLKELYIHCHKFDPKNDREIVLWGLTVESWATAQVQIYGWTYKHVEQIVVECRLLVPFASKTIAKELDARYL